MMNYLAILVSAVAAFLLGGLWYSPFVFGKLWIKLSEMTEKELREAKQKSMVKSYLLTFVSLLIMAFVLASFLDFSGEKTLTNGLLIGFWGWLGFIAMTHVGSLLWENKSPALYALNMEHWLAVMLLMGLILGAW